YPVFGVGQRVINGVGVSPAAACVLIDQCLNAGHDRRRDGGAAESGPGAGRAGASKATANVGVWVGPADDVIGIPDAVGGEQGDIGDITDTVGGIAEQAALEGWLRVARAGPADLASGTGGAG